MPRGIAIDWVAGNVYWTDSGRDVIEVAQMKGENRKTLISGMIDEPHAIVVDPLRGCAGFLPGGGIQAVLGSPWEGSGYPASPSMCFPFQTTLRSESSSGPCDFRPPPALALPSAAFARTPSWPAG